MIFNSFYLAVLLVGLLAMNSLVLAEEVRLDAITVEASKTQKDYFDMSESVLVLDPDEIMASGGNNDLDVLSGAPNIEINSGKDQKSFSIRGINSAGVTGYQKDNLASLVIDSIFQTDLALQAGSFHLWDMQNLEVLRGAQSTDYGINSLAGSIFLNHNKAGSFNEGSARFSLGNNKFYDLALVQNYALGTSKKNSLRVSYNKELRGGYITNIQTRNSDWGKSNTDRVSLNSSHRLSSLLDLNLTAKFNRRHRGGNYTQGSNPFDYEVDEDVDYHLTTNNYQLGAVSDYKLGEDFKNRTLLAYSGSWQDGTSDADGTNSDTAGTRFEEHKDHFVSLEDQILYKGESVENILGLHVHHFNLKDDYKFHMLYPVAPGMNTPIFVDQFVDRKRFTLALFDSLSYHLSSKQSLDVGLRGEYVHSQYATEVYAQRTEDLGPGNAPLDAYINEVSGPYDGQEGQFVVLPKLAYLYRLGAGTLGLKYTRGYRTSGVSINRRQAKAVEYDPEFTNNYELSYKYAANAFHFALNTFYIDWREQQVLVQKSSDFFDTQVENAARSTVIGAETEGKFRLSHRHSVYLGVGYTDTEFKDFHSGSEDYSGNEFPFAAHWSGRLSHEWQLASNLILFSSLRALSESYTDASNEYESEAQFYADLNLRYIRGQWIASVYLNNAFDGQYLIFNGDSTSTATYPSSYHQVSTPRDYGLRLSYNW